MREREDVDTNHNSGGSPAQTPEQGSLWLGAPRDSYKSDTRSGKQYAI